MRNKSFKVKFLTDTEESSTPPIAVAAIMNLLPREKPAPNNGRMRKQIRKMRKSGRKFETEQESVDTFSADEPSDNEDSMSQNLHRKGQVMAGFMFDDQRVS